MSLENVKRALGANDPVAIALAEDLGAEGDVTCRFFVDRSQRGIARIVAKEPCVLAGVETVLQTFRHVDADIAATPLKPDGSVLAPWDMVVLAQGRVTSLLMAERVALNFLQRLSGVATVTARYVEAVRGTKARILDTRKTTPGLRLLEKAAVRAGGGTNHRMGLHDMVMVKDNHLSANADLAFLREAVRRTKQERPGIRVEFEADTLEQVELFLEVGDLDVILLDNMSCDTMRQAVQMGKGRVQFEASGGITLERVREVAETGVDFISVGALTHSAVAVDFSMELVRNES